jgi:hypothetical protein
MVASTSALLVDIKEDTYLKAFLYASFVVGLTSAFTLEYRLLDPFRLYDKSGASTEGEDSSTWNIAQTAIASGAFTFIVLWTLQVLFGLGRAWVSQLEQATAGAPLLPSF